MRVVLQHGTRRRLRQWLRRRRLVVGLVGGALGLLTIGGFIGSYLKHAPARPGQPITPDQRLDGVTVILDPGHGGTDSGARRAGLREDVLNYRMTSAVATELSARGARVVFTVRSRALVPGLAEGEPEPPMQRPADATLIFNGQTVRMRADRDPADLYRRSAIAVQEWKAEPEALRRSGKGLYFLALHCDELGHASGRGARVYYDRRVGAPSRLAGILQRRLTAAKLTNSDHGMVIPRRYGVLNPQYNPVPESVLLEMMTMSNAQDRKSVLDPAWRWRLARLIADSIAECERS